MPGKSNVSLMIDQLADLRRLYEQLLMAVRKKQTCMRSGDMAGLESWSAREKFLIERVTSGDEHRRQLAQSVADELDVDRELTLTQLSAHVDEPERSKLLALAGAIRNVAEQVYQVNQVNDAVTRDILDCFAQMHRQFAQTQSDIGLYDPKGERKLVRQVSMLDAVG